MVCLPKTDLLVYTNCFGLFWLISINKKFTFFLKHGRIISFELKLYKSILRIMLS